MSTPANGPAGWLAAWSDALDELERDVQVLEQAGADPRTSLEPAGAWRPPVLPCPLPESLHERAAHILQRQLAAAAALSAGIAGNRQQARLLELAAPAPGRPKFLDSSV